MLSITILLYLLTSTVIGVHGRFGPTYKVGPSNTYIIEAETTLFLPSVPTPQQNSLLIWAGMDSDTKDRYQGVVASYAASKRTFCNAAPGQWCAYGRIYTATGRAVALDPFEAQDGVKIHFSYNSQTGRVLQTLSTPRRVLASFETASGKPKTWATQLECQIDCGNIVINAHTYRNTTIRLATEDPSFGNTVSTGLAWTPNPLVSYDAGKSWSIPIINIQQVAFSAPTK